MKLRRDLVIPAISLWSFYFPFLESQAGQFAVSIKSKSAQLFFFQQGQSIPGGQQPPPDLESSMDTQFVYDLLG